MSGHRRFAELVADIDADPIRRARVDQYEREMRAVLALGDLRALAGLSQTEAAHALGVSQANVSRLEHEEDVYLWTLREYVESLGGQLEVNAVFPDGKVALVAAKT